MGGTTPAFVELPVSGQNIYISTKVTCKKLKISNHADFSIYFIGEVAFPLMIGRSFFVKNKIILNLKIFVHNLSSLTILVF